MIDRLLTAWLMPGEPAWKRFLCGLYVGAALLAVLTVATLIIG